jgi:DNA primase
MNILDLAYKTGIQPKRVSGTQGGEYHSACPTCGGKDRFYIQPQRQMTKCVGFYSCRKCGITGDAIQFARDFLNYSFQEAAQCVNATIEENSLHSLPPAQKTISMAMLQKPHMLWTQEAKKLIMEAHKQILHDESVLNYLAKRGLPLDAVVRYKLGVNNADTLIPRCNWGLEEVIKDNGQTQKLWIPHGIVIPTIELSGDITRIKIRRLNLRAEDILPKYIAISGSMNGLNIIGSQDRPILIIVESELDAYAVHYAVGDFAVVIAVGSNIKNPDNVTNRLAKNTKQILICHDNDEAGLKMLNKWQTLYSHAIAYPTPIGKDIGEAIEQNLNIRNWILTAFIK